MRRKAGQQARGHLAYFGSQRTLRCLDPYGIFFNPADSCLGSPGGGELLLQEGIAACDHGQSRLVGRESFQLGKGDG